LVDSGNASRRSHNRLHPQSRFQDTRQISRGKFDRLLHAIAGFILDFRFCDLLDNLLTSSDAFIHAGSNVRKMLWRSIPNG
jgi:hypothetical protein